MATLTMDDDNKTVSVPVGRPVMIKLKGNPTTGYTWTRAGFADPRVSSDEMLSVEINYHPSSSGLCGAAGEYQIQVTPNKPGSHEVDLVYRRTFEPPKKQDQQFRVTLKAE